MKLLDCLKFGKDGLIPAIIQDYKKKDILMFAYMSRESLLKTLKEGRVCFYSRSRKKLWLKGEQSGNFQLLKQMWTDCDGDVLLLRVLQKGGAACHTGRRSCFYNKVEGLSVRETGRKLFDPKKVYKKK